MHNICRIISRRPRHVYRRRRLVSNLIDDSSTRLVGLDVGRARLAAASQRRYYFGSCVYIICYILFVNVLSVSSVVAPGYYFVSLTY